MAAPTFVCKSCGSRRRLNLKHPPVQNNCLRCRLRNNKLMTMKAFASVTGTEDNQEFKRLIDEWYLNDA